MRTLLLYSLIQHPRLWHSTVWHSTVDRSVKNSSDTYTQRWHIVHYTHCHSWISWLDSYVNLSCSNSLLCCDTTRHTLTQHNMTQNHLKQLYLLKQHKIYSDTHITLTRTLSFVSKLTRLTMMCTRVYLKDFVLWHDTFLRNMYSRSEHPLTQHCRTDTNTNNIDTSVHCHSWVSWWCIHGCTCQFQTVHAVSGCAVSKGAVYVRLRVLHIRALGYRSCHNIRCLS